MPNRNDLTDAEWLLALRLEARIKNSMSELNTMCINNQNTNLKFIQDIVLPFTMINKFLKFTMQYKNVQHNDKLMTNTMRQVENSFEAVDTYSNYLNASLTTLQLAQNEINAIIQDEDVMQFIQSDGKNIIAEAIVNLTKANAYTLITMLAFVDLGLKTKKINDQWLSLFHKRVKEKREMKDHPTPKPN